jgi:hypothetical protein
MERAICERANPFTSSAWQAAQWFGSIEDSGTSERAKIGIGAFDARKSQ